MKTTIDIPDQLLLKSKRIAKREHMSLRGLVEAGLRMVIQQKEAPVEKFTLRNIPFGDGGLMDSVTDTSMESLHSLIYEDRGA